MDLNEMRVRGTRWFQNPWIRGVVKNRLCPWIFEVCLPEQRKNSHQRKVFQALSI